MLQSKPIPLQVLLVTILRFWICGVVVTFTPMFFMFLGWGLPTSTDEATMMGFMIVALLAIVAVCFLVFRALWRVSLGGAVGFAVLMLGPLLGRFLPSGLEDLPREHEGDLLYTNVITFLITVFPVSLVAALHWLEKKRGPVVATREDVGRAVIRVCIILVALGALAYLAMVSNEAMRGFPQGWAWSATAVVFAIVLPVCAWRTWHYHWPSALLLAVAGIERIVEFYVRAPDDAFSMVLVMTSMVVAPHLVYVAPAVVLWWFRRQPETAQPLVDAPSEAEEQPC